MYYYIYLVGVSCSIPSDGYFAGMNGSTPTVVDRKEDAIKFNSEYDAQNYLSSMGSYGYSGSMIKYE